MNKLEDLEISNKEHDINNGIETKKVSIFGYDPVAGTPRRLAVDENGMMGVSLAQKITTSGNYVYMAKAPIGSSQSSSVWQVKRIETSGSDIIFTWAEGNANFSHVASDLTLLNYS